MIIVLALFIARPLRLPAGSGDSGRSSTKRQKLLAQKAAYYAAIREIDADVQLGKLELSDYRGLRNRYAAEAVAVLKALDDEASPDPVSVAIETHVEQLKEGRQPSSTVTTSEEWYCGTCGAPADLDDRFCAHCGASLKE
jgi:hypothetical protein